jgi:protein-disulfide isomerase
MVLLIAFDGFETENPTAYFIQVPLVRVMERTPISATSGSQDTTRRRVLAGTALAGSFALAGCLGSGQSSSGGDQSGGVPADALSTPVKGDSDAGTTVTVFEDFACPHCRDYVLGTEPQIDSQFVQPGAVRYEHHDLPIPVDETISWQAASAARAVQDRAGDEAFFTYATRLYENQDSLAPEQYASLTDGLDVEGSFVRTAATNERYRNVVEADRQAGLDRGVEGTPAVFVNDQTVEASAGAISMAIESSR